MSKVTPSKTVKEAEIETVRRWLNARPDLLLAIAKRHTTNPLLTPLPSPTSTISLPPTLNLVVPLDGLTVDKLRIKVSTTARNVEVDIPLSSRTDLGKGGFGKQMEEMGYESLKYFQIPGYPKIDYFEPPTSISVLPIYGLMLLLFLVLAPSDHGVANLGRGLVNKYLGKWVIPAASWLAASLHFVIEPLIILPKLRQHSVPLIPSLLYLLTVLCIGYGGIDALNRAVIQERIKLIHSQHTETRKGQ
ncbi:uncharacterized protein IL334_000836 [Kwoniella shivajii]|uniref:Uncharacterized protein n=1 Tax=Kwoniella shivajii TaxID=564305 RepID=A0ABZ1CQA0_9TREE|nr:hypothetical protein IL334_000836 [Kwoniella shivajii]